GSNSLKIAVDVPSGMDANTGRGFSFLSDVTVTMGLPKIGMFLSIEGQKKCGKIIPVDIGFPKELVEEVRSRVFFIEKNDICRFISKKPVISHKGDFGRPLLIAGSDAYPGALILCAGAALKANAGVITALASEKLRNILLTYYPEVTYKVIKHNATISNYLRISINFSQYSSIGFGPGICNNKDHSQSLSFLFNKFSGKPLIIDADGINILAQNLSLLRKNSLKHVVLTPHPKEFSRLSGFSLNEILKDRMTCIQQFSRKYRVFIVLKGYNSLISTPEGRLFVNSSGNPCLSTAGTGDVLTGILSAFSGFKDKELIDAIISSVYIHGLAGDLILQEKGSYGITASDIIEKIPQAINSILR
ncbi:MAG: NAD(P)H-hydrate dehydratase, partial [Candidatus Aureabacteria bacterium]|nr:NAD(P)H-hydrate dehydratase [Candidatus Auribacterota bacterium]